jgi:hypothetical protein
MMTLIQSLRDVQDGPWTLLGEAFRAGLAIPNGFVLKPGADEAEIRSRYDDLKTREHTHYMAVRSAVNAMLDVIGSDALIHTLRRMWAEFPQTSILVQCMINASWCGKASWEGKNLRVRASEGLRCLDPDSYLFNTAINKCTRRTLYQHPRKVFRAVDGRTRTMEITGERHPLETKYLEAIAELATRAAGDITWALDDRRAWLLGTGTTPPRFARLPS